MNQRDTGDDRDRGGIPRWVKVIGIVVAVLVLLVVIVELAGLDAGHGPSRHQQGDGIDHRPPVVHTGPDGHTWPPRGTEEA